MLRRGPDVSKPRTRKQLWSFIGQTLGVWLPARAVTPGHSCPFDFVADAYFNPGKDVAAWANRRGGKTLAASILAALEYRFGRGPIQGRVLAGSEDQAKALYGYWSQWCWKLLADLLNGPPRELRTRLLNGDFEILAASEKKVRGPGIQRLYWDEVDEIDPVILAASVGTLNSLKGVPARTVTTSTWHRAHGPMGELVASAARRGIAVHKWNIWECIQACPPERHEHGRGCRDCPLGPACLGKARQVRPGAEVGIAGAARHGLLAIDDVIRQYRQWSTDQWLSEAECQRPVQSGLVYPKFDRLRHVVADLDIREDLPTYRAIDWGLNDFVCLWVQLDKHERVYVVDELWTHDTTVAHVAKVIKDRHPGVHVEATYCDPAGRNRNDQTGYSDVGVFKDCGIPCSYSHSRAMCEVHNGINMIRGALDPAVGPPRLKIAGRCEGLIRAFESYRCRAENGQYVDDPVKPQPCDHPMDALRYYFVNRHNAVGGGQLRMGWGG